MNRSSLLLILYLISWSTPGPAQSSTNEEVAARSDVIDFAGAFQNDGFKIRDGNFSGKITKETPAIVAVNLYNGNAYWFTVSSSEKDNRFAVAVFDEKGSPITTQPYQAENRAAAGFAPESSGLYYVKIALQDGTPSTFCLIYSYK
ncbi:MAG: hypothetical protein JO076_05490 [Verrucomicrobia bacterium]|nr:hypothetical protein [Verrucomicrobiota bacterium]